MNSHSKSKSEVYFQYVKYYVALRRLRGQAVRSSRSFVLYFSSSRKKKKIAATLPKPFVKPSSVTAINGKVGEEITNSFSRIGVVCNK